MKEKTKPAVPVWYWLVATAALLWNLIGCMNFGVEVFALEAAINDWTDAEKEWARSIPTWIYFVFAIAVTTGTTASIGLLLRKSWTIPLFAISLIAMTFQILYSMFVCGGFAVFELTISILLLIPIVVPALFLWFSWFANKRGWFV